MDKKLMVVKNQNCQKATVWDWRGKVQNRRKSKQKHEEIMAENHVKGCQVPVGDAK